MADALTHVIAALRRPAEASSDFDLNPGTILPAGRVLRPAGVLVPILGDGADARLILTKRSSALKHHPGQIAFPGGKQDLCDVDVTAAALREAREEIGLDPANVEVLGTLPTHETVSNFTMTPVLGRVKHAFQAIPEAGEVDEIFEVPLMHVLDLGNYRVEARYWRGGLRHYYVVPFGPYYIWGATARILNALASSAAQT